MIRLRCREYSAPSPRVKCPRRGGKPTVQRVWRCTTALAMSRTAADVHAFDAQAEEWLNRVCQARSNPRYPLDLLVPADLLPWALAELCPHQHVDAMLAGIEAIKTHAEAAMAVFDAEKVPPDKPMAVQSRHRIPSLG